MLCSPGMMFQGAAPAARIDMTPDAFSFGAATGATPTALSTSGQITLTGFNHAISVAVSGGGAPQINVNGAGWTSGPVTGVTAGATLQVRLTASDIYNSKRTATVNAGGVTANYEVTTEGAGGVHYPADGASTFLMSSGYPADGGIFSISLWWRFAAAVVNGFLYHFGRENLMQLRTGGVLRVRSGSVSGGAYYQADTNTAIPEDAWTHVAWSINSNAGAGAKSPRLRINGGTYAVTVTLDGVASVIDYDYATWRIGSANSGSSPIAVSVAQLWVSASQQLDFTNSATLARFRDPATGKPVYLGADGSTPTGTQPLICLPTKSASLGANVGTGSAFSPSGNTAAAASSPSD